MTAHPPGPEILLMVGFDQPFLQDSVGGPIGTDQNQGVTDYTIANGRLAATLNGAQPPISPGFFVVTGTTTTPVGSVVGRGYYDPTTQFFTYDLFAPGSPNQANQVNHVVIVGGTPTPNGGQLPGGEHIRPSAPIGRAWVRMRGLDYALTGDRNRAMADLNNAIQLQPTLDIHYVARGLAHLLLNEPDPAIADFDSALQIRQDSAPALYGRGIAYAQQGDRTRATYDITAARAINPHIDALFAQYHIVVPEQR